MATADADYPLPHQPQPQQQQPQQQQQQQHGMASYGTQGNGPSQMEAGAGGGGAMAFDAPRLPPVDGRDQEFMADQAPGQRLRAVVSGRPMFATADVYLEEKEQLVCDGGAIAWMDGDMEISTGIDGGCMKGCARTCSGESCCMNTVEGPGRVGVNMPLPGDMMTFVCTEEHGWLLSKGAFIAGTPNCSISAGFAGCAGCCTDEGLFMTKITSNNDQPAYFIAGGFGGIQRVDVPAGESLLIDNGMLFAAHHQTKFSIALVGKNLKTACFSAEGIAMRIQGPATVYCQSRDPSLFRPLDPTKPDAGRDAQ